MRAIRRNDLVARIEMLPLIDVIFLLLTFFIYSMVLMAQAQILPVKMTPLDEGRSPQPGPMHALSINRDGKLFFNRSQIGMFELEQRLNQLGNESPPPTLYLAVEQAGSVDRGPLLVRLIEQIMAAGITDIAIVGPAEQPAKPIGP